MTASWRNFLLFIDFASLCISAYVLICAAPWCAFLPIIRDSRSVEKKSDQIKLLVFPAYTPFYQRAATVADVLRLYRAQAGESSLDWAASVRFISCPPEAGIR